jgi:selT/selW/selH-like putative selenoprotein
MRAVELQSGSEGRFEISLDGELVFSKKQLSRFPKPGEIAGLFEKKLGPPLEWRSK